MEKRIKYYQTANYYTIDEYGNVYNHKTNRFIKPTLDAHGYYQVKLYKHDNTTHRDNDRANYLIHRLVAFTYLDTSEIETYDGKYSNKFTVDHIDGNKTNNYYKNLRWIPFLDNCNYAKALGYNNPDANYENVSEELVLKVINDICDLYTNDEICNRHNVSSNFVTRIRQKKRWGHLTNNIVFPKTYAHKSREETLTYVYYALYSKLNAVALSKILKENGINVSSSQIYNIRNGVSCIDYIEYIKNGKFRPSTTILEVAA